MQISQAGLEFITSFEGYHTALPNGDCKAYRCQIGQGKDDGVWTIGFGCTEGVTGGMVWTRQQAEDAFRRELAKHEKAVERLSTVDLNQNQFDSLVSFSFNVGSGALSKSTLLKKLNAGDFEGAARQFPSWVNSNGVKRVPGLVRRRAAEAALFRKPVEASPEPDMPQAVDVPSAAPTASRTVATANAGQMVTAGGLVALILAKLGEMLGYATQALPLIKSYGFEAFILVMFVLSVGFALVKHFRVEDHVEGKANG